MPHFEILQWLLERCSANLASDEQAQEYLRSNGVADGKAWSAFRLGVADGKIVTGLDEAGRETMKSLGLLPQKGASPLRPNGILVPTFDPCSPHNPVGLVKVSYSQNQHRFLTPPSGLICAPDIADAAKVIIADSPLLGLRLLQAGATGVVVADVPEVLPPLSGWLSTRQLVLVSYKSIDLDAMASALGELAANAARVLMPIKAHQATAQALAVLGLPPGAFELPPSEPPPLTQAMIVEIVQYAQRQIAAGLGREALASHGADEAEFVQVFGVGYLPEDFLRALPTETRKALAGRLPANAVLIPAFDERGVACDAYALKPAEQSASPFPLSSPLRGMIAPKIATAYCELVLTDSFRLAAKVFRDGWKNVLFMRGAADAELNTRRLIDSGVTSATVICHREGGKTAAALSAAGIGIEHQPFPKSVDDKVTLRFPVRQFEAKPSTVGGPSPLVNPDASSTVMEYSGYDPKTERAAFRCGDAAYQIEVATESQTRLEVRLEREGKLAIDRFDLASEVQRRRFAVSAALKTKVAFERIMEHLVDLLERVRRIQSELSSPSPSVRQQIEVPASVRDEALAFLGNPGLLDAIAADLEALGWVGDENNKRLLYLTAVSRKLDAPLSAVQRAPSGAGKSFELEQIAALVPPEDVVHVSRLTDSSLYYQGHDALQHRLLLIDESDALTPEVFVTLRVLQSRGELSQTMTERDSMTGKPLTRFAQVRGPVAVLTSSTGALDGQFLSRCYELSVDDSPEQTQRILAAQRKLRSDRQAQKRRAQIVQRHHAIQRLLSSVEVLIPFADRIEFPASSLRHRREQERFLNLIEASALLHQHQRMNDNGTVLATERDFQIAAELVADSIGRASDELSANGRDVLALIVKAGLPKFTMDELKTRKPDWTRYRYRAGLDELLKLEVLTSPVRGRGKVRQYELQPSSVDLLLVPAVRLRSDGEVGELANVGEIDFANFTPDTATG